jgi:hypothetical protein
MGENNGITARRARHFDHGFGFAVSALAIALTATCSASLPNPSSTGTAGTGGTTTAAGTAGIVGGDSPGTAGGGAAGTGGTSPCPFPYTGASCGSNTCMMGTGNYCGTSVGDAGAPGGRGGSPGSGGTGGTGTGGSPPLPACPTAPVTFGVCFVNDADVLPLPPPTQDPGTRTNGAAAATVTNVGTGAAPASCESARSFGAPGPSGWWFQARTGDNRLWTIGVHGLGATPLVHANDSVTLNLDWRGTSISSFGPPSGRMELTDAGSTPLLWAVAAAGTATLINNGSTWLTMAPNAPACAPQVNSCDGFGYDMLATVNGSQAVVAPNGATDVGGYHLVTGAFVKPTQSCADYFGPPFAAAAVKLP